MGPKIQPELEEHVRTLSRNQMSIRAIKTHLQAAGINLRVTYIHSIINNAGKRRSAVASGFEFQRINRPVVMH